MKKAKGTASSSTSVDVPLRGSMRTVKVNSGKNGGVPGIWPCRHAGNRFVFLNNADSGSKTQCGAGGWTIVQALQRKAVFLDAQQKLVSGI